MDELQESVEQVGWKRKANKNLWKRNIIKKAWVKGEVFVDLTPHLNEAAKRAAAAELVVHKRKSNKFYNRLKKEVENRDDPHILAISFYFMRNDELPNIPVQETFYLRQLSTSVFCIHDIKKNDAVIYLYQEGTAKKGPNEVCSFVYDYLQKVSSQYTELRVFRQVRGPK
ncbi:pre-mRNA-processing factor 17 [Homalodisca vitripennis]|nr:pre-mRNA-processing factor 17 [Homalodisca vitripennis]